MGIFDKFKPKKIEGVDQSEYLTLKEERRISAENKRFSVSTKKIAAVRWMSRCI